VNLDPEPEEEEEDREWSPDVGEVMTSQYASHFSGKYLVRNSHVQRK
jgi:hypothetical protein